MIYIFQTKSVKYIINRFIALTITKEIKYTSK